MPRLYAYDANEFTQKNLLEVFCHCYDNPYCLNIFQCAPRAIKYVSTSSSSMLKRAQKEIAFPSVLTRFYQSHRQKICL